MNNEDTLTFDNKWQFDEAVAKVFDNMLERSIPEYTEMRRLTNNIGVKYVQPRTAIIDMGCSNGNAINDYVRKFGYQNTYKLYDVSEPMLNEARERYKGMIENGVMEVCNYDITKGLPNVNASLILSVLTLQFTPIEYRQNIVKSVYDRLTPGGAFIFVEKVLGNSAEIDEVLVSEYYKLKGENGYTQEQIQSKRKSLEGVLVPLTANWNVEMLKEAGFTKIDCFWRHLNFAGWLAIK